MKLYKKCIICSGRGNVPSVHDLDSRAGHYSHEELPCKICNSTGFIEVKSREELEREIQQLKAEIEELNTVIKLQREEAVRHEKRSMDQDKRIRELEGGIKDVIDDHNEQGYVDCITIHNVKLALGETINN